MKNIQFHVLTALLVSLLPLPAAELVESTVTWEGSMPAKTHNGIIPVQSVEADITDDGTLSALEVVLDMTKLANADINKEKNRRKLEKHLKSEDFFYVEQHPEASFNLKKWADGRATGVLTIRGVEVERTIPLTLSNTAEGHWKLESEFSFNRQKFNVNYQNSGFFGTAKDKIIKDEVDVGVDLLLRD